MSLQKCVQVEHTCLFHLQGNKLNSALPPTSQACFCILGICFGYFLFLEFLCSRHLQDKLSHFLQVFAQNYCFSKVYPDDPNLKLELILFYPLSWPLLFQIFFILIYFSVFITLIAFEHTVKFVYLLHIYCLLSSNGI